MRRPFDDNKIINVNYLYKKLARESKNFIHFVGEKLMTDEFSHTFTS